MNISNFNNYGEYEELARNNYQTINTSVITENSIDYHYNSILNIMLDAVEQEDFKRSLVHLIFTDNKDIELSIPDYLLNLIMWTLPAKLNQPISSYYLFFLFLPP